MKQYHLYGPKFGKTNDIQFYKTNYIQFYYFNTVPL